MHAIESLNRLTRARGVLDAELGRDPRPEDRHRWVMKVQAGIFRNGLRTIPRSVGLAARMGVPIGKIQLLLDAAKYPASFEALVGESEETPLGDLVRDVAAHSPEEAAIRSELAEEVERAMAPLTEREREVLRLGTASAWGASSRSRRSDDGCRLHASGSGRSRRRPSTRCARHAARVKTRLPADPAVSGLQIDVDTRDRIVTLTGAVNRNTEKARAVELASNIENVIRVEDRSTVRPRIP